MSNYRRAWTKGGCFFFTVVTHDRRPWLCAPAARTVLRHAIETVRRKHPFRIDAWVLLPDHLHCIWTLPDGDVDFSLRWRLIKLITSRQYGDRVTSTINVSRRKRGETGLWQRRFWEHRIRDGADFSAHCDYIHYNPVRHGLCLKPWEWPYSTFRRFVEQGIYPSDWGTAAAPTIGEKTGRE